MRRVKVFQKLIYLSFIILLIYSVNVLAADNANLNQTGVRHFNFVDKSRNKTIAVEAWYPIAANTRVEPAKGIWKQANVAIDAPTDLQVSTARNGKLPLIVLSHGFHGSPETLSWLASDLVKHGFIVVAAQHDDTGPDSSKPYMAHWERAIDISDMLRELQTTDFGKNIDFSRVGMAGYSLGTATGLWLAGARSLSYERTINPGKQFVPAEEFPDLDSPDADYLLKHTDFQAAKKSYREPLIKSVFLMAPGYGWAFQDKQLAEVTIPVFLVAAEKDEMLYPETNAYYFSKFITTSVMKIIPDVGHFIFINETIDPAGKQLSDEEKKHFEMAKHLGVFQYTAQQRNDVQQYVGNLAANFFLETLE